MGSSKRVEYIDIAKALGIIFVIIGHTVTSDTLCKNIIYAFHMPLFFMLSGMVAKPMVKRGFNDAKVYAVKKLKAIMLPYAIWGLIYSHFSFKNAALIAYGTRETLIKADSLTSLWYLPVTFLAVVITEVILGFINNRSSKQLTVLGIAAVLFAVGCLIPHYARFGYPWGSDIVIVAAAFMLVGNLLRQCFDKLQKIKYLLPVIAVSGAVFVICVRFSDSDVGYVLMANAVYGNPLWFLVNAVSGSVFVIAFSCAVEKFGINKKPLLYVGQRTLGIFIIHKPIVELCRKSVNRFGYDYNDPIAVFAITVFTLIASAIAVFVIGKIYPEIIGLRSGKEKHFEKN